LSSKAIYVINFTFYIPDNDNFATRTVLFGTNVIATGNNVDATLEPGEPDPSAGIKALDPETGKTVWDFKTFQGSLSNGLLATAGNVIFASIRDGNIAAFDAKTGKALWRFQTGAALAASPMSYAVDGRQFIAMAAGNFVYGFALPETK